MLQLIKITHPPTKEENLLLLANSFSYYENIIRVIYTKTCVHHIAYKTYKTGSLKQHAEF